MVHISALMTTPWCCSMRGAEGLARAAQFNLMTDASGGAVTGVNFKDVLPSTSGQQMTLTDAGTPTGRVENANAAARVEPRREGYYNAIQIYPWSEGALYQVYAAVGQITTIALNSSSKLITELQA